MAATRINNTEADVLKPLEDWLEWQRIPKEEQDRLDRDGERWYTLEQLAVLDPDGATDRR